ncbi:MAG: hypothetical protein M3011_08140 [Actinomycetota bacterium]|nr:hypothetical protein [Actinomycetota bacterium]
MPDLRQFHSRLALWLERAALAGGCQWTATVTVDQAGAGRRVTLQGWPAPSDATSAALAYQLGVQHLSETAGFEETSLQPAAAFGWSDGVERHFVVSGPEGRASIVERCLVAGSLSMVGTAPHDAVDVLEGITLQRLALPPQEFFGLALSIPVPGGGSVHERMQFSKPTLGQQVTADHFVTPPGYTPASWLDRQVEALRSSTRKAEVVSRGAGRVIEGLIGEIATLKVAGHPASAGTIGVVELDGELFEVATWVPERGAAAMGWLAQHPRIQPVPDRTAPR